MKKHTHLIYLNKEGYAWMQEHGVGEKHPENAEFYCDLNSLPSTESSKWIVGKPEKENIQYLTLSPFFPSGRLDFCIEINRTPKIMQYENHPAFEGCVKYMPIDLLNFKPIPKYIPRAIYTIGLCHYGHSEAYKSVDIPEDNRSKAIEKGRKILNPNTVEHVKCINFRPNEEYDKHYNKKTKLKL